MIHQSVCFPYGFYLGGFPFSPSFFQESFHDLHLVIKIREKVIELFNLLDPECMNEQNMYKDNSK